MDTKYDEMQSAFAANPQGKVKLGRQDPSSPGTYDWFDKDPVHNCPYYGCSLHGACEVNYDNRKNDNKVRRGVRWGDCLKKKTVVFERFFLFNLI